MPEYDEHDVELGRRLAAAYVSYVMGVGVGYQYKRMKESGQEIGAAWIELGRQIHEAQTRAEIVPA